MSGHFPQAPLHRHAAFFLRFDAAGPDGKPRGFWVIEQYNHPPIKRIQARLLSRKGKPQTNGIWPDASNNADAFYVIE